MSAKVMSGLRGEKNQIPSPYARRKGLKKRKLSLIVFLNQFCCRKGPMLIMIMTLGRKCQIMHCLSCFICSTRSSIRDDARATIDLQTGSNFLIFSLTPKPHCHSIYSKSLLHDQCKMEQHRANHAMNVTHVTNKTIEQTTQKT